MLTLIHSALHNMTLLFLLHYDLYPSHFLAVLPRMLQAIKAVAEKLRDGQTRVTHGDDFSLTIGGGAYDQLSTSIRHYARGRLTSGE
jgi:hypothetical protein